MALNDKYGRSISIVENDTMVIYTITDPLDGATFSLAFPKGSDEKDVLNSLESLATASVFYEASV